MEFHSFFIQHQSGIPIYFRHFSETFSETNIPLFSSFFGAIHQFAEQVIAKKLYTLEMGTLRFFFRYLDDFIIMLVTSSDTSALLVNERFEHILELFQVKTMINSYQNSTILEDEKIDSALDNIIAFKEDNPDEELIALQKIFEVEISRGEIQSGALISLKGDIYYSSLPLEELETSLREIELRSKASRREIISNPKFMWQGGDKLILSQIVTLPKFIMPIYVVLVFDSATSLGMADYALEDIVNKIDTNLGYIML